MLVFTCAIFSLTSNIYAQCVNGLSFGNLATDITGPTIKGLRLPTNPGDIASNRYLQQASDKEGSFHPINNYRVLNPESDAGEFPYTKIVIDKNNLTDDIGFLVPDFQNEEALPLRFSDGEPIESTTFFLINDYHSKNGELDTSMGIQWLYAIPPDASNTGAIRPSENVNTGSGGGYFYRFRDGINYTTNWSPWIRLDNREIQTDWLEVDSIQINDQKIRSLATSLSIAVREFNFTNNQLKDIGSADFAHYHIEPDSITGTDETQPLEFNASGIFSFKAPTINFNQGRISGVSSIDQLAIHQQRGFRGISGKLEVMGANGFVNFISSSIKDVTSLENLDIDGNSLTSTAELRLVADTNLVDFQNSRLINLNAIEDIEFATGHNRRISASGSSESLRLSSATQEINFNDNSLINWHNFAATYLAAEQAKIAGISFYATGLTTNSGDMSIKVANPSEDQINFNFQKAKFTELFLEQGAANPLAMLNFAPSTIQVTRYDTTAPLSIDSLADAVDFNQADLKNVKSISASSVVTSDEITFLSVEIRTPNTITTNKPSLNLSFSANQNIVIDSDFVVQGGVSLVENKIQNTNPSYPNINLGSVAENSGVIFNAPLYNGILTMNASGIISDADIAFAAEQGKAIRLSDISSGMRLGNINIENSRLKSDSQIELSGGTFEFTDSSLTDIQLATIGSAKIEEKTDATGKTTLNISANNSLSSTSPHLGFIAGDSGNAANTKINTKVLVDGGIELSAQGIYHKTASEPLKIGAKNKNYDWVYSAPLKDVDSITVDDITLSSTGLIKSSSGALEIEAGEEVLLPQIRLGEYPINIKDTSMYLEQVPKTAGANLAGLSPEDKKLVLVVPGNDFRFEDSSGATLLVANTENLFFGNESVVDFSDESEFFLTSSEELSISAESTISIRVDYEGSNTNALHFATKRSGGFINKGIFLSSLSADDSKIGMQPSFNDYNTNLNLVSPSLDFSGNRVEYIDTSVSSEFGFATKQDLEDFTIHDFDLGSEQKVNIPIINAPDPQRDDEVVTVGYIRRYLGLETQYGFVAMEAVYDPDKYKETVEQNTLTKFSSNSFLDEFDGSYPYLANEQRLHTSMPDYLLKRTSLPNNNAATGSTIDNELHQVFHLESFPATQLAHDGRHNRTSSIEDLAFGHIQNDIYQHFDKQPSSPLSSLHGGDKVLMPMIYIAPNKKYYTADRKALFDRYQQDQNNASVVLEGDISLSSPATQIANNICAGVLNQGGRFMDDLETMACAGQTNSMVLSFDDASTSNFLNNNAQHSVYKRNSTAGFINAQFSYDQVQTSLPQMDELRIRGDSYWRDSSYKGILRSEGEAADLLAIHTVNGVHKLTFKITNKVIEYINKTDRPDGYTYPYFNVDHNLSFESFDRFIYLIEDDINRMIHARDGGISGWTSNNNSCEYTHRYDAYNFTSFWNVTDIPKVYEHSFCDAYDTFVCDAGVLIENSPAADWFSLGYQNLTCRIDNNDVQLRSLVFQRLNKNFVHQRDLWNVEMVETDSVPLFLEHSGFSCTPGSTQTFDYQDPFYSLRSVLGERTGIAQKVYPTVKPQAFIFMHNFSGLNSRVEP